MVADVQQKQARNNPYGSQDSKEHPDLYETFRTNWYKGYAAGFLSKAVIGGGAASRAKSTLKSADRVQDLSDRLASTGALRALSRVSDATDAAKARATARILLAADDAAGPVVRRADTAGQAVRLWRLGRAADADLDALPDANQRRLGDVLARADGEAAETIQRMDRAVLEDFTAPDVSPAVRVRLPGTYADLDAARRADLTQTIDGDGRAARNAATLDSDGVRDALDFYCGGVSASVSSLGAPGLSADRFYSGGLQDRCSIQTDFESNLWQIDSDLRERLDRSTLQTVQDNDLGSEAAQYLQRSGDVGGQRLLNDLADADDDRLDSFLTYRVETDGDVPDDLADGVRRSLTRVYDDGRISSGAIGEITRDIDALTGNDQVDGLSSVLADDVYGTGNWDNIKGALYEVRIANQRIVDDFEPGDELVMGYKPNAELDDFDYDSLSQTDIEAIAQDTGLSESTVETYLKYGQSGDPDPEFDSLVVMDGENAVYYEAKSGRVSTADIKKKATFLKGLERQADITQTEMRLISRLPRSDSDVRGVAWDFVDKKQWGDSSQLEWDWGQ
ncbi:hypothetical protein C475_08606 [Halosimplex carlsbadense 2-9-1]|uniref:Uncharacterized protein n=1 Tax=Halosimplex carlsbadense 2-9-1 TaxID=797114 RepID=M0CX24_9EURY|nr:hypothetical protein [Halosimplex carlsbadense]ELZ26982.1 hypothetical protein C475_08606 [Halosimplex carlsbadense 2-9-1]